MSERAEKKLKMQFGFIIIFIFIIGAQLIVKNYFVNHPPAWTTRYLMMKQDQDYSLLFKDFFRR